MIRVYCNVCGIIYIDVYCEPSLHKKDEWVWQCEHCCGELRVAYPVQKEGYKNDS